MARTRCSPGGIATSRTAPDARPGRPATSGRSYCRGRLGLPQSKTQLLRQRRSGARLTRGRAEPPGPYGHQCEQARPESTPRSRAGTPRLPRQPQNSLKISSAIRFLLNGCDNLTNRAIRVPQPWVSGRSRRGNGGLNGARVSRVALARVPGRGDGVADKDGLLGSFAIHPGSEYNGPP